MRIRVLVLCAVVCFIATWSLAEIADRSPEELQRGSTNIVVGKVQRLYESKAKRGGYAVTYRLAEILVTETAKGDGLAKDKVIHVRYWTQRWARSSPPPPGTNGHRGLPKLGDTVRVFLTRAKDGGLDVILPNGFGK